MCAEMQFICKVRIEESNHSNSMGIMRAIKDLCTQKEKRQTTGNMKRYNNWAREREDYCYYNYDVFLYDSDFILCVLLCEHILLIYVENHSQSSV